MHARSLVLSSVLLVGCGATTNETAPTDAAVADDAGADVDATASDAGVTTHEATYRVLHWNIAGGKENDCQPALITAAVMTYIRDRDADFVGLNEVCPAQYEAMRDALRTEWGHGTGVTFSAFVGDASARVVGNAIFSRFAITGVTREKLGEDQYGDRNLLCGKIAAHRHLRICSTHLTPGDTAARAQLDRGLARIEGWWQDFDDTVLLTGDLNLHPNDVGLDAVYAAAASDPVNNPNNAGRYRELDDTHPGCPGYGEGTVPGNGGPCQQGSKIDFIIARANRIVDSAYSADTLAIPSTCSGACSDHRAVVGQVKLRVRAD